jgi:hypothetical protein
MSYVYGQNVTNRAKFAELPTTPPLGTRDKRVIQMFSAWKFASQTLVLGHRYDAQRLTLKQCHAVVWLAVNFSQPAGRGPWLLARSFHSDHTG